MRECASHKCPAGGTVAYCMTLHLLNNTSVPQRCQAHVLQERWLWENCTEEVEAFRLSENQRESVLQHLFLFDKQDLVGRAGNLVNPSHHQEAIFNDNGGS